VTDLARLAREALSSSARERASRSPAEEAGGGRPPAPQERKKARRETRILPFSLDDIIDETTQQG
jgi:hypothetical protein